MTKLAIKQAYMHSSLYYVLNSNALGLCLCYLDLQFAIYAIGGCANCCPKNT